MYKRDRPTSGTMNRRGIGASVAENIHFSETSSPCVGQLTCSQSSCLGLLSAGCARSSIPTRRKSKANWNLLASSHSRPARLCVCVLSSGKEKLMGISTQDSDLINRRAEREGAGLE